MDGSENLTLTLAGKQDMANISNQQETGEIDLTCLLVQVKTLNTPPPTSTNVRSLRGSYAEALAGEFFLIMNKLVHARAQVKDIDFVL